jgi:alpha/beta superfamily hydrolase
MKQSFFGSRTRALFGNTAAPSRPSREGAVLCYPAVYEYNQSHWAFKKLQLSLARSGLHVLRFDYYGTGDSAGELEDGTLAGWEGDVRTALEELAESAQVRSLSLVGMGLGAALAVRVARKAQLKTLVLWNPVISGSRYIDELFARDEEENLHLLHGDRGVDRDEAMGYPFSRSLRLALTSLDLLKEPVPKTKRVQIFSSHPSPLADEYAQRLKQAGVDAAHEVVVEEGATNEGAAEAANLSTRVLAAITETLTPQPAQKAAS